jgi:hypothetical protein
MNRCHRIATLALALLCAAQASIAGTPPPQLPYDQIAWKATLKTAPADSIRMGAFDVRLEKTTLDDVRRAVASGEISHQGDAGESKYWLCYTDVHSRPVQRLWIIADGEMGGSEHVVTRVTAQIIPASSQGADCPVLPDKLTPLSTNRHVWLGSSTGDATGILGTPSFHAGSWLSFDYQGTIAGKCSGGRFDYLRGLVLGFENGRVTTLHLWGVTSC